MKVLLSIKPQFAELIFNGIKKYEFRKSIFKSHNIKTIVVYASSPIQRVIGEFDIATILNDAPEKLWENTHQYSGVSKELFFNYFARKNMGFAIKVEKTRRYKETRCLRTYYNLTPPQSFCYIK